MKKKSLDEHITQFLEDFKLSDMIDFMEAIYPIIELYETMLEEKDWVVEQVGAENAHNVRIIRTVYLFSRLADFYSGRLCLLSARHKGLWRKMEKEIES